MALIDESFYQQVTGEEAPESFATLYTRVLTIAEACLGRDLEEASHTERLAVSGGGWVYPKHYPITGVTAPSNISEGDIYTHRIHLGWAVLSDVKEITYTAGWTPETAPKDLRTALAFGIYWLQRADAAGAKATGRTQSWSNLDASESFFDSRLSVAIDGVQIPAGAQAMASLGSIAANTLWRYRRV